MIDIVLKDGKMNIKDDGTIELSESLVKDFEYDIENNKNNFIRIDNNGNK